MVIDQPLVQHNVVFARQAVTQLLDIGLDQRAKFVLVPAFERAVQPGAIDQLGRRHAAQEIQGMRAVCKIAARCALLAFRQVGGILGGDRGRARGSPAGKLRSIGWELARFGGSAVQLLRKIRVNVVFAHVLCAVHEIHVHGARGAKWHRRRAPGLAQYSMPGIDCAIRGHGAVFHNKRSYYGPDNILRPSASKLCPCKKMITWFAVLWFS